MHLRCSTILITIDSLSSVCKQGEMEGSKRYKQREQEAANMWRASEAHKRNLDALAAPVPHIQEILAQPIDVAQLQQVLQTGCLTQC